MDPLFPALPEDLSNQAEVSNQTLEELRVAHVEMAKAIRDEDAEVLGEMTGDDIIAELKRGAEQIEKIDAEIAARGEDYERYVATKDELLSAFEPKAEDEPAPDDGGDEGDGDEAEAPVEVVAEEAETTEEPAETVEEEEKVLVTASADPPVRFARRAPTPSREREPKEDAPAGTSLVAAGTYRSEYKGPLDPDSLAELVVAASDDLGPLPHDGKAVHVQRVQTGDTQVFGDRRVQTGRQVEILWAGPKTKIAKAEFPFPEERTLNGHDDVEKIRAALPRSVNFMGKPGEFTGIPNHADALVASGGLCAPLTPIYSMPNFATEAEPVWDSLPVFRAARGGVNVPDATYIADIETAISSISEEDDEAGGTFATKSCQALVCPDYTETAVQILAHCREYGNLNARAWPEKIAHENAITMAALSRTSETFMLDRIKALSINVTQAAIGTQYGSFASLVHAIVKASAGIKYRLRMPRTSTFRVLLPSWIPDHLAADNAAYAFDRFLAQGALEERLSQYRITVAYYLDDVTGGTSQGFAAEEAGALDEFPDDVQYAIYPEGTFIGIDSGTLELGIVRDSTLNTTNDFQIFGERFRNLARLGPAQAALWITQDICPTGSSAAAATALTC